ncbi:MAG: hypothetical protein ACKOHM_13170, partial [Spartobacteria bacterium]
MGNTPGLWPLFTESTSEAAWQERIIKTTDYPDEHGYKEMGKGAFAARMGQKQNSASGLAGFLLFSANPSLPGSFDSLTPPKALGCAHPV